MCPMDGDVTAKIDTTVTLEQAFVCTERGSTDGIYTVVRQATMDSNGYEHEAKYQQPTPPTSPTFLSPPFLPRHHEPSVGHYLVAVPDLGTGHLVRRRVASPLVVPNTGISLLIDARDLDQRAGVAATVALDAQLQALDIKLSTLDMSLVQTDMLEANEVLAGGCLGGDGELHAVLVVGAPVAVLGGIAAAETRLPDLEPVARAVVGADAVGGLGHVDESRAGVLDEFVVEELEGDAVAGVDLEGAYAAAGLGADVAAEVVLVDDVGEGRVIRVGVAADVGVLATVFDAVDEQDVEDVVGVHRGGRGGQSRKDGELHGGKGLERAVGGMMDVVLFRGYSNWPGCPSLYTHLMPHGPFASISGADFFIRHFQSRLATSIVTCFRPNR